MIAPSTTRRPRNVDSPRAAAILYGDWGTSKAYVIGLAFAVGGYGSFWLIAAMCVLTALVGLNYMVICRHYPDGGGVYASVRHRSEIVSIVGAFLLIADYIVTAAISALSAFDYMKFPHPEIWAALSIAVIGALNLLGPRHTGGLAFLISVPAAAVVLILAAFSIPHLGVAVHHLQPLTGGFAKNWKGFVGVVLALSGVEAIANATGVMKLNKGCTDANPNVSRTSTPAILWVMLEVCLFTALLSLAIHALPNLTIDATDPNNPDVNAPGANGVRDYMLRYMGQMFVGGALGHTAGLVTGVLVAYVFGFLLLSAVNTAIVDLIAISFLMSRDGELPPRFQKLNQFGVPSLGLMVATVIPIILVVVVKDMSGLADLYAVGVVGAIATNLGASSTDRKLGLGTWERTLMFFTFLIMLFIEISLLWDKPDARLFAGTVLLIGLLLRGLAAEYAQRSRAAAIAAAALAAGSKPANPITTFTYKPQEATGPPMMCAIRGLGRTLDFAIDEARQTSRPLYLLYIRTLPVLTAQDYKRKWQEDEEAREIFLHARDKAEGHPVYPCYAVSDSVADTIVDITATMGASYLILGAPERRGLVNLLRGSIIREISDNLPDDIHLLVLA
ncbi:MAG: universal stress protein [Verrucomicrobiota bacterium]|jgi:amino acid transporter/nucleotide-binding universal stress UspA family protein